MLREEGSQYNPFDDQEQQFEDLNNEQIQWDQNLQPQQINEIATSNEIDDVLKSMKDLDDDDDEYHDDDDYESQRFV